MKTKGSIDTTKNHFELFKKECKFWVDKLELNDWKIYYTHEDLGENCYARCHTNLLGMVATIRFSTKWVMVGVTNIEEGIKKTAKHEVIHLLLGRVSTISVARYVTESEQIEAEESLVRKLEQYL